MADEFNPDEIYPLSKWQNDNNVHFQSYQDGKAYIDYNLTDEQMESFLIGLEKTDWEIVPRPLKSCIELWKKKKLA